MTDASEIRKSFEENGQGHIFAGWDTLSADEQAALLDDCNRVNFDWIKTRVAEVREDHGTDFSKCDLKPAPVIVLPESEEEKKKEAEARATGEAALKAGKLAAFLVAGGQGTRLGFDGPKGCYEVGPLTGKTLFQWHAEQILALAKRHGATIPWYIMTSRTNHVDTVKYFEENNYLGFDKKDVMFFQQRMVPSVDFDGKLILADKCGLALNPDGHGGSLHALVESGAIADMKKRGIETISYFQVDNPLVTICDPVFAGYHLQAGAEMSSKILNKAYPEEKVGHICYCDGKLTVIEYSDMDEGNMYAKDENGKLKFWAGSIAIHMLSVDFVDKIGGEAKLPWHIAKKKIPFYNGTEVVTPEEANGIKFETFVFDSLPMTSASITMEVAREEEFAPVKNKSGIDSADSCRQLLSNRFAKWLKAAGVDVAHNAEGDSECVIEISPLFALDADELKSKLPAGTTAGDKLLLE
ncbi:MAG: UDPGP type 1 family protein [Planctomycetes bacterium]|nr:UDPGP type 1 family protein [Planctomycetota bacterium]